MPGRSLPHVGLLGGGATASGASSSPAVHAFHARAPVRSRKGAPSPPAPPRWSEEKKLHSLITPLMMHDRELLQRVYRAEQAAAARPQLSAARSPEGRQRRARAAVPARAALPSPSAPVRRRACGRSLDQPTFYLASSTVDDDGLWHNPASSPSRGAHRSPPTELSAGAVSPAGRRGEAATLAGHRVALQRRPWRPSTAGGFRSPPTPPRAANLGDRPRHPPRSPTVDDVATKIAAVELQRHARGLLARRGGAARAPVAPMAAVVSRRKPR